MRSKRHYPGVLINGRTNKVKRYTRRMLMNVPGHKRFSPQEKALIKRGILKKSMFQRRTDDL